MNKQNIMLILLVILAIVLTFIKLDIQLFGSSKSNVPVDLIKHDLFNFVKPRSFSVATGTLSFYKISDSDEEQKLWSKLRPQIFSTLIDTSSAESMSKVQFFENLSKPSVLLSMPSGLSIRDYLKLSDLIPVSGTISDELLEEILVSESYLSIKTDSGYYQMPAKIDIGSIAYTTQHRRISDRFSLPTTIENPELAYNYTLIPVERYTNQTGYLFSKEFEVEGSSENNKIVREFFGDKSSFVKTYRDINGSLVLMYGYGEKTLTFANDGSVILTSQNTQSRVSGISIKTTIEEAINFLMMYGRTPEQYKLTSVEKVDNDYYLNLTYTIDGLEYSKPTIKIHIKGRQVLSLEKKVLIPVQKIDLSARGNSINIDDCITQNSDSIISHLSGLVEGDGIVNYFVLRSLITGIEMKYQDIDGIIVPVWCLELGGKTFIFDSFSGKLLETS